MNVSKNRFLEQPPADFFLPKAHSQRNRFSIDDYFYSALIFQYDG